MILLEYQQFSFESMEKNVAQTLFYPGPALNQNGNTCEISGSTSSSTSLTQPILESPQIPSTCFPSYSVKFY